MHSHILTYYYYNYYYSQCNCVTSLFSIVLNLWQRQIQLQRLLWEKNSGAILDAQPSIQLKRSGQTLSHNIVNWMHSLVCHACSLSRNNRNSLRAIIFPREWVSLMLEHLRTIEIPDEKIEPGNDGVARKNAPRRVQLPVGPSFKFLFVARDANTPSKTPGIRKHVVVGETQRLLRNYFINPPNGRGGV